MAGVIVAKENNYDEADHLSTGMNERLMARKNV